MKRKKITAVAFALLLGMSTMVPARAALPTVNDTMRTESFYVYKGGPADVSAKGVRKASISDVFGVRAKVTPNSGIRWGAKEVLNVRGITLENTKATDLGIINYSGELITMPYSPGHGTRDCHYGVRASYSQSNGGTHLAIDITWAP